MVNVEKKEALFILLNQGIISRREYNECEKIVDRFGNPTVAKKLGTLQDETWIGFCD